MTVFVCGACGRALTRDVREVRPIPAHPPQDVELHLPATLEVGTWAIDPEPLVTDGRGKGRGDYNCPVLNPDDLLGDLLDHTDPRRLSGCCGRDGLDGPNVLCPTCKAEVATVSDDCWTYREARLVPTAVRAG